MSGSRKRIAPALQGGGSHGAFTWGVLDRLLEAELDIVAISGTSAGSLNAAALAYGHMRGGSEGAREALHALWRNVSRTGDRVFNPYRTGPLTLPHAWNVDASPLSVWLDMLSLIWSPYYNPFYENTLERVVRDAVPDFDALNAYEAVKLFICAINVQTNERRIFRNGELSVETMTASCCLPNLYQAVGVGGQFYWDGGYIGDPALEPLLDECSDIVIVQVNPMRRKEVPTTAPDILDRLNEVSFNASLVLELHTIRTVTKLLRNYILKGDPEHKKYKPIYFHRIADDESMSKLGRTSKNNTSWDFLEALHGTGRAAAERWLGHGLDKIGRESSLPRSFTDPYLDPSDRNASA